LIATGARKFACGLSPAGNAKPLRAQPDGKVIVTDGPYTETKEHIGGFWIVPTGNGEVFEMMEITHVPNSVSMCILPTVISVFRSAFRSRAAVELENFALRHRLNVLKRSVKHRPRLTSADRLLWVVLSRLWADWRSALTIVQPETVIAWHRKAFRLFGSW